MAFLFQQPGSPYWYAGFYDSRGVRKNRSTRILFGPKNRKAALRVAEAFESAANTDKRAKQILETLEEIIEGSTGRKSTSVSLGRWLVRWLNDRKLECSTNTLKSYRTVALNLLTYLGKGRLLDDIKKQDVLAFRSMLAKKIRPETVNNRVKIARAIFRQAIDEGLIDANPADGIKSIKTRGKSKARHPLQLDHIKALMKTANDEWKSIIRWGFYTGQRLGDLAALHSDQIDFEHDFVEITTGKTGKKLRIPLAPDLKKHLPMQSSGRIHPKAFELFSRRNSVAALSNQFARMLHKIGLRDHDPREASADRESGSQSRKQHKYSFHSLRMTATSMLHEKGVPPATAQALIGHDSEDVHEDYIRIGDAALREASQVLPALD